MTVLLFAHGDDDNNNDDDDVWQLALHHDNVRLMIINDNSVWHFASHEDGDDLMVMVLMMMMMILFVRCRYWMAASSNWFHVFSPVLCGNSCNCTSSARMRQGRS